MPRHPLLPHLVLGALLTAGALGLAGDLPAADPPRPAFLGINLEEVDDAVAYHLDLKDDLGVMVVQVLPDSPASRMGLRRYDVVVKLDGRPVYTPRALRDAIASHHGGETVEIAVRRGSATEVLSGTLGERPKALDEERLRPGMPGMPGPRSEGRGHDGPPQSGRSRGPDGTVREWHVEEAPGERDEAP